MTMSIFVRIGISRVCLLAAALLCLLAAGSASAKVGVTSATDGDPLGKPPNENERVLRIGIDVQADEVVTTRDNDRAHLMFMDGTSLTVGPNAQLTIDKFVYDPNTKQGQLAITTTKGVFRLVGGKISKTNAVEIKTPSTTIGIRGGITIFEVSQGRTTANFIFGNSMTASGNGQTVTASRPGSQIIVNTGAPPSPPVLLTPGALSAEMGALETGKSPSSSGGGGGNADQTAQTSGFSNTNTGGPPNNPGGNQNQGGGNPPNTNNNALTQVVSNTSQSSNPTNNTTNNTNNGGGGNTNNNNVPKTTQMVTGYTNGLIVEISGGRSITTVPQSLFGTPDISISTNATTNVAEGSIVLRDVSGISSGHWWNEGRGNDATVTLQLGGNGASGFVNNTEYALAETTDRHRHSTVQQDDRTRIIPNRDISVNLFSYGVPKPQNTTEPSSSVTAGIPGSCTCAFLTWGWWSADVTSGEGHDHHDGRHDRDQTSFQVVSAPYVVGTLTTAMQMPMTGSATYNGFMTGSVMNGSNSYSATGSYSSVWNFAARLGSFNASFDGTNYNGGVIATTSSGVSFTGAFANFPSGRIGTLSGSFFGPSAQNQAGQFSITGRNYLAGGIFAGSTTSH